MPEHNGHDYDDPLDVLDRISPLLPTESFIGCILVFQHTEAEGVRLRRCQYKDLSSMLYLGYARRRVPQASDSRPGEASRDQSRSQVGVEIYQYQVSVSVIR